MPKLTLKTLLARAKPDAYNYRASLLDSYSGTKDPYIEELKALLAEIKSFEPKTFKRLSEYDKQTAFQILLSAQDWNYSLAYSVGRRSEDGRAAVRIAEQYEAIRMQFWGETELERSIRTSKDILVTDLFKK